MSNRLAKEVNKWTDFLCGSVSTVALLGVVAMAQAQEGADENGAELVEEVEVVGIRRSMEQNLNIKRFSGSIVDAITAEDIGKFPDKNVADALQRIPGVSIVRSGGEGVRVSIRGTDDELTFTQLNGNYIASTPGEPVRSFDYSLLPSPMIHSAEVYKSPQARFDEGGVGGTVHLHTRKPLDMDAGEGVLAIEDTYADVTEKHEPQFTGIYSWKNASATFGVLVGYSRQDRQNRALSTTTENWGWQGDESPRDGVEARGPLTDIDGNEFRDFYAPRAVVASVFEQERTRSGTQLTLQWLALENLELGFNYFRFELGRDSENYRLTFPEWNYGNGIAPNSPVFDADGDTLLSIGMTDNDNLPDGLSSPQIAGDFNREEETSETFDFNATYAGNGYSARFIAGNTAAEGGPKERFFASANARFGSIPDWRWDLSSGTPRFSTTGNFGDPANYPLYDWFSSSFTTSEDEESYYQVDFDIETNWGLIESVNVGAKYRDHEINRLITNLAWDDDNPMPCPGIDFNGDGTGACYPWWPSNSFHTDPSSHPADNSLILSGSPMGNIVGGAKVPAFAHFDWNKYRNWLQEQFGDPEVTVEDKQRYTIGEEITSAYFQANYVYDEVSGNIGVRVVETSQFARTFDTIDGVVQPEPNTRDSSYTDVLPSFNLAWNITDELLLRAATAKVVSRVQYNDLGGAETIDGPLPGQTVRNGNAGNSDLEPFEADQFDVGLEWYYSAASAAGFTLFRKEIDSFVILGNSLVTRIDGGQEIQVNMRRPVNGTDATSEGIELFVQHAFDNGFGVLANYTYTDTSLATIVEEDAGTTLETELPGASKDQYNLSAYYENELFSVRVSYNYRSEYASGFDNGTNTFTDEYDQVDVNATYNINEDLVLSAAVINLTEESSRDYWGDENRQTEVAYTGRRMYVGLNYNF